MKLTIALILSLVLLSCNNEEQIPILKTNSKTVSIKDGENHHDNIWSISPEVELDAFFPQKFKGEKEISFISDIDTLSFNVTPSNTYNFIIQHNKEKAYTQINTDASKEPSIPAKNILDYYTDNENRNTKTDTIPFTLKKDNRIHLTGSINKSDSLNFIFDTGANAIVITSKLIGNKVNLKLDGNTINSGSDGTSSIETSSSNHLKIAHLNWDNVNLLSIDYQGRNFDGVLGWIVFENKIIELDYEKQLLIIHQSINTIPKGYTKIETKMIDGVPYIKGTILTENQKAMGWLEYDTGYSDSFSLSQKFASENHLNNAMPKIGTSISTGSAGIEWKANDYILPKLKFAEFELNNVPLSIDEEDPEGIEHNDILGNSLLKRFNAIIDLQNFEIYLKPNHLLNSEY